MQNKELEIRKEEIRNAHFLQLLSMLLIVGVLLTVAVLKGTSLRYYSIVAGSLILGPVGTIVVTSVPLLGKVSYETEDLLNVNRHMHVLNRVGVIVLYASFGLLIAGMITAISIGL